MMDCSLLIFASLKTAFLATLVALVFALPLAFWSRNRRGRFVAALDGLLFFPGAVSPTILAFVILRVFGGSSPVGQRVESLGRVFFFWPAIAILGAAVAFPLVYQGARRALDRIDDNLVNSMRVLGFSDFALFWKVMLPLAWPGILAGLAMSFVRALGEFGAEILMVGYGPGNAESAVTICTGELALAGLFIALALLVVRLPARTGKPAI